MKTKQWEMPPWMEKYREHILNTGGNKIEDLVNGHTNPIINLPLSTLEACVKSQIGLLGRLYVVGLLGQEKS